MKTYYIIFKQIQICGFDQIELIESNNFDPFYKDNYRFYFVKPEVLGSIIDNQTLFIELTHYDKDYNKYYRIMHPYEITDTMTEKLNTIYSQLKILKDEQR